MNDGSQRSSSQYFDRNGSNQKKKPNGNAKNGNVGCLEEDFKNQFVYGFYIPGNSLNLLYKAVHGKTPVEGTPTHRIKQEIIRGLEPGIRLKLVSNSFFCGVDVPSMNEKINQRKLGEMRWTYYQLQINFLSQLVCCLAEKEPRLVFERIDKCKF